MNYQPRTYWLSNSAILDRERLNALDATGLLDSPPDENFDRLTKLACRMLQVPVSLVSLVDQDRQFFKSAQGLPEPWASTCQTPLSLSFCQHVVSNHAPLIVNDARNHSLVCDNPAIRELGVIAYLGIPLLTPDGYVIGSLCAIDHQPRTWSEEDVASLTDLAALTMKEIESRFHLEQLRQTERTLRQRTEELERSNQDLEQFTHVAAHDMGNLLNTITVSSDLLKRKYEENSNTKERDLFNTLGRATRRMKELLEDLLSYARSGHQDFEMKAINLSDIVSKTLEDLNSRITKSQVQVQLGPLPMVLGDETYLSLLFQNLLENAIKYRNESTPRIELSATRVENYWQVSLQDNGIGIEEAHLESIFEPFQRINRSDKYPGSGIGLATCKRIVDRHGGQIWAESELGMGTVFHFMLLATGEK